MQEFEIRAFVSLSPSLSRILEKNVATIALFRTSDRDLVLSPIFPFAHHSPNWEQCTYDVKTISGDHFRDLKLLNGEVTRSEEDNELPSFFEYVSNIQKLYLHFDFSECSS